MTETKDNALQIALNFDLETFWSKHLSTQKLSDQTKDIEFTFEDKPLLSPTSQAGKIWGSGRMQNILRLQIRRLSPEKTKALQIEVEQVFTDIKADALTKGNNLKKPALILKKVVTETLDTIDIPRLETLTGGYLQDFSKYPEKTVEVLAKIRFIQWAKNEIENTHGVTSSSTNTKMPLPLQFTGKKSKLYYMFKQLKNSGDLGEASSEKIAEWLKLMFENLPSLSTVKREVERRTERKTTVQKMIDRDLKAADETEDELHIEQM